MRLRCGYPAEKWRQAKREVKAVLIKRAKARDIISYKELVGQVTAIQLEPQSLAFSTMLREIAADEHAAGRGMLTAVVVYSSGDMQPGPGFFDLAGRLGKNTNDVLRCWIGKCSGCTAIGRGPGVRKHPIAVRPNEHEFMKLGRVAPAVGVARPFSVARQTLVHS